MNKNAQTEIVGLMIIVVIISIGMLFYLSYSTNEVLSGGNVSDSIRREFIDNELSMGMVQTIVRTTVPECDDQPVDVLIRDIGLGNFNRNDCQIPGDLDSFLHQDVLIRILEDTLGVWDKSYQFRVNYNNGQPDFIYGTGDCLPGQIGRRPPGVQPIPYFPEPGTAFVELAICNK